MKIALIIQGPISSGGLSGKTWGKGKTKAPREHFVEFDSSKTVMRNIEQGSKEFDFVILTTWSDENTSFLDGVTKDFLLLKNSDPGAIDGLVRSPVKGIKHTHENNATRQFQGTLFGLLAAKALGFTHAVKIRTDQEINLRKLKREVVEQFEISNDVIIVPFIDLNVPWSIPDFYMAFNIEHGIKVAKIMSCQPRFNTNVHIDLFMKTLLITHPHLILPNFKEAFFYASPNRTFEKIIRSTVLDIFLPGTRELFLDTIWRGERIIHQSSNFLFSGDPKLGEIAVHKSDRRGIRDTRQALKFLDSNSSIPKMFINVFLESVLRIHDRRYGLLSLKQFLQRTLKTQKAS